MPDLVTRATRPSPPDGWVVDKLVHRISLPDGQVDPKQEPYRSWPLIAPDHVESGTGRLLAVYSAAQQGAISGKYAFRAGDVIYSKIRPYLRKATLADMFGICSADMYPLRPGAHLHAGFLLALILGEDFTRFASAVSMRSGFPKINREELAEYETAFPPYPEQRRIAEILDTADATIQQTEALIAKLRLMRAGLIRDLLGRVSVQHTLIGSDPNAGHLPTVRDEFDIMAGIALGPHRQSRHNGRPYLRVANVHKGRLVLDDVAQMEATDVEVKDRSLKVDDLLVVEGHANPDEIGRCARVTSGAVGMIFQNHLFRLRAIRLKPAYAEIWLNGDIVRAYWRRMCGTSSGLNTINRTMLEAVPVVVPSPSEQDRIIGAVDAHDARIRAEEAYRDKLKLQKQGLMHDLLTGKVRVKP